MFEELDLSVERSFFLKKDTTLESSGGVNLRDSAEHAHSYSLVKQFLYDGNLPTLLLDGSGCLKPSVRAEYEAQSQLCSDLLEVSADLYPLVGWAVSSSVLDGPSGLVDSLEALLELLSEHWSECYPPVNIKKPSNPVVDRYNALYAFSSKRLRWAVLDRVSWFKQVDGGGEVSLRSAQIENLSDDQLKSRGITTNTEEKSLCVPGRFASACALQDPEVLLNLRDAFKRGQEITSPGGGLAEAYNQNSAATVSSLGGSRSPGIIEFSLLNAWFEECGEFLATQMSVSLASSEEAERASKREASEPRNHVPNAQNMRGSCASSDDVQNLLEKCATYFQRNEKSNPAYIYIVYALEFYNKPFLNAIGYLKSKSDNNLKDSVKDIQTRINTLIQDADIDSLQNLMSKWEGRLVGKEGAENSDSEGQNGAGSGYVGKSECSEFIVNSREDAVSRLRDVERYISMVEPFSVSGYMVKQAISIHKMNFLELLNHFGSE